MIWEGSSASTLINLLLVNWSLRDTLLHLGNLYYNRRHSHNLRIISPLVESVKKGLYSIISIVRQRSSRRWIAKKARTFSRRQIAFAMTERIRLVRHSDRIPISLVSKTNERRGLLIIAIITSLLENEQPTRYGSKRCVRLNNVY